MGETTTGAPPIGNVYFVYRNSQWMELDPQTLQIDGQDAQLMFVRGSQLVLLPPEEARHVLSTGDGLEHILIDKRETCLHMSKKNMKRRKESESRATTQVLQEMTSHISLLTKLLMQQRLIQPTAVIKEIGLKEKSNTPERAELKSQSDAGKVNVQSKINGLAPESGKKPHIVVSPSCLQAISKFSDKHLNIISYRGQDSVLPGTFDNDDAYCQALLRHLNPIVTVQRSKFRHHMREKITKEDFALNLGLVTMKARRLMSSILEQRRRKRTRKQSANQEIAISDSEDTTQDAVVNETLNTSVTFGYKEDQENKPPKHLKPSNRYGSKLHAKQKNMGSYDEKSAQKPMTKLSQKTHPSTSKNSSRSSNYDRKMRQTASEHMKKISKKFVALSSHSSDTENSDSINMTTVFAIEDTKTRSKNNNTGTSKKVNFSDDNRENRPTQQNSLKNYNEVRIPLRISEDARTKRQTSISELAQKASKRVKNPSSDSSDRENSNSTNILQKKQPQPQQEPTLEKVKHSVSDSVKQKGKEVTTSQSAKSSKRGARKPAQKSETDYYHSDYSESSATSRSSSNPRQNLYSKEEDYAILKYVQHSVNCTQVKGTLLWKQLERYIPNRSWQSLKNRYLRNILPNLGAYELSLEKQKFLRACAYRGEIQKKNKRNSLLKLAPTISASKYMLMKRKEQARKQDDTAYEPPSQEPVTRPPGAAAGPEGSSRRRGPTSSTPRRPDRAAHGPTPTYSQLTRQFRMKKRADLNRSSKSSSPPTKLSPGKRKLFNSR